ncbi:MAG TPA: hypothetical protein ENG14_06545 [Thermodesulforhabdus norvegica]|uniref:Class III cytochrome C domain-containing protein n=1 Tax=Thermodesulforhabdus norvegica TaxID=39841 RepID=A0A7C0WSW6_9BACT|nr:cytochrome c3 family protein [Deltaproteobacteria bacterium]MBW2068617.1 cytochrome c3 family protein [Deltaproteobacteria bacterium]HDL90544.1 hypothetical protein [Thermodesulforhabdus norvegica]
MRMNNKFLLIAAFIVFLCSVVDFVVLAQDEIIELNHRELEPHQRPVVKFPHALHENKIDCIRCHHDFDKYGVNNGSEGESCTSCHNGKKGLVSIEEAYHIQCIGCHRILLRKGLKTGPVQCGDCHKKIRKSEKQ